MDHTIEIEHFWKESGFYPNNSQREAILHVDGPLLLTAGPGSGKTRVLLWRTLNLIVFHGVDPAEIFLSTFTEKAATPQFAEIFDEARTPEIESLDPETVASADAAEPELGRSYSYTGDYLLYQRCPRNYMIYRKYGSVPPGRGTRSGCTT